MLVGHNPDSELYVRLKKKACDQMGIEYIGHHLGAEATQKEVNAAVLSLQKDPKVSGILVQLPLPEHIDEQEVLDLIGPEKDVDGLHPLNIGRKRLNKRAYYLYRPRTQEALASVLLLHTSRVSEAH